MSTWPLCDYVNMAIARPRLCSAAACTDSPGRVQAELERILEENQKKLEQAKAKPAEDKEEPAVAAKMQNLAPARQNGDLIEDVFVLGTK